MYYMFMCLQCLLGLNHRRKRTGLISVTLLNFQRNKLTKEQKPEDKLVQ